MIVALADHITLTDLELRAYEQALEPKKLVTIEGGPLRCLPWAIRDGERRGRVLVSAAPEPGRSRGAQTLRSTKRKDGTNDSRIPR